MNNEPTILNRIDTATGDELFFAVRMLAEFYEDSGGPSALLADGLQWLADEKRKPQQYRGRDYDFYITSRQNLPPLPDQLPIDMFGKPPHRSSRVAGFFCDGLSSSMLKSAAYIAAAKAFAECKAKRESTQ